MSIDEDREVALVGGGIAAAAGLVLLASPFIDWYQQSAFCYFNGCGLNVSGFSALGAASAVLVCAGIVALLPLVSALLESRATRLLSGVGAAAGLGAALLVMFRIAAVPASVSKPTAARLAGIFVALLGAVGVVGGSALAGIGRRLFDRVAQPRTALTVIAGGSVAMVVSLFTPWVRASPGFSYRAVTETAWQTGSTLAVLLLLGALAIMCAAVLVAVIRWRAAFFALAVGGWLAAAIAAAATVLATRITTPGGTVTALAAYEPGYYVFLVAAGAIVFAGLGTAIGDAISDTKASLPVETTRT
jgi:hypothetical protein